MSQITLTVNGRAFTTTMGSAQDLLNEAFRRLLVNACYWAVGLERRIPSRADVRLVTLVGPPGIGKTRLSIEAAQGLVDYFERGVRFVSLAPIRDPGLVASAIAQTVGVREAGTFSPTAGTGKLGFTSKTATAWILAPAGCAASQ